MIFLFDSVLVRAIKAFFRSNGAKKITTSHYYTNEAFVSSEEKKLELFEDQ